MRAYFWALIIFLCLMPSVLAEAQASGNAICVVVFDDANGNNIQDAGETPFAGITVTLALETNLIVQSHITNPEPRPHCFNNLPDGNYVLTFVDSPNHRTLMQNSTAITLANGQSAQVRFAAIPQAMFEDRPSLNPSAGDSDLSAGARLALGTIGAGVVAILMLGLGIFISAILYR